MSSPCGTLETRLEELRGISRERMAQLHRLQLHTAGDLLRHAPRRHEDRRRFQRIADLKLGEAVTVRGRVVALGVKWFRQRKKSVFELILEDDSARLHCRWWNLPFMQHYFKAGDEVLVYGKPHDLKPRTIDHPETEVVEAAEDGSIHLNRITPVYPLTEGLPQRWLRALIHRVVADYASGVVESRSGLDMRGLPTLAEAWRQIHFPEEWDQLEQARQRLALEEFLDLQIGLQTRRRRLQKNATGLDCRGNNQWIKPFLAGLGFALTKAQTRVLQTLRHDMSGGPPMRRLVQGDVGSGKTVVAACCALMALESGCNALLMAPTEILASQHYQTFRRWFEPLGIDVCLRAGQSKTESLRKGAPPSPGGDLPVTPARFTVGTHALIEESFAIPRLGLVIIDEQHKFGVAQREQLLRKGHYPHLLVMTATPIPRTLGLTLYGDLDVSVIDELPGARGGIRTFVRSPSALPKVWEFVRTQLLEGRQVYVVYPRVEEGDKPRLKSVTQEYEKLSRALAPHAVGLLHGRLKAEAKEEVMQAFRAGRLKALLSTTVVEVGVDVPNASVMVVENADQFGLAQLHQLRGRIGRGRHESYCILIAEPTTDDARTRLAVMAETSDGFRIAEEDLKLRGPGELLGQSQSGLPPFRFGDLAKDGDLIERARALAARYLDQRSGE